MATDASFAASIGQASTGFRLAFRQALPVLVRGEASFLRLFPTGTTTELSSHSREDSPQHAHTLVHEGVLACQEMLNLLERIDRTSDIQPGGTRRVLQGSLATLSESTASVGWELRTICHEYTSELKLSGIEPSDLEDLGPGAVGLIHEMAVAAHHLRGERRAWFRIEQRLATAAGTGSPGSDMTGTPVS
ncbi:MAG: hypothetical protein ABSB97_05030 [Thermoplasmata archaeon]